MLAVIQATLFGTPFTIDNFMHVVRCCYKRSVKMKLDLNTRYVVITKAIHKYARHYGTEVKLTSSTVSVHIDHMLDLSKATCCLRC